LFPQSGMHIVPDLAWINSASVRFWAAPGAAPIASAGYHAVARGAASAERAAARSAAFARRCSFFGWLAGVLLPAAVGASGTLRKAARLNSLGRLGDKQSLDVECCTLSGEPWIENQSIENYSFSYD
jgi:hypothetical protein